MSRHLTEEEILAAIPALTRTRLVAFIETELVIPVRREQEGASGFLFRQVDFARVQLLCELAEDLELDEGALGVIITLLGWLTVIESVVWLLFPSEMRRVWAPLLSETLLFVSAAIVLVAAAVLCFFGYIANTRTGARS